MATWMGITMFKTMKFGGTQFLVEIRWVGCWALAWSGFQHVWYRNCKTMEFKYGCVFQRKNAIHSFENALLIRAHFLGYFKLVWWCLMFAARFSWVPNLYNLHFLLENHMPQPDPVNSYRDVPSAVINQLCIILHPNVCCLKFPCFTLFFCKFPFLLMKYVHS